MILSSLFLRRLLPPRIFLLSDNERMGGYDVAPELLGMKSLILINLKAPAFHSFSALFCALRSLFPVSWYSEFSLTGEIGHRGLETAIWTFRAWNILTPLICSGRREWGRWWLERRYFPGRGTKQQRAVTGKILRLNKRQRFSLPTPIFRSL